MAVDAVAASSQRDVHPLWHAALDAGDELGIDAHLEERAALGASRELGIDDLVVVRPKRAFAVHSNQEVDVPDPGAVEQGGLVDDVGTFMHEAERSRCITLDVFELGSGVGRMACTGCVARLDDDSTVDDLVTELAQVGEEALLVLQAALLEDGELGVIARRPVHLLLESRSLEHAQVLAFQESDQVARRIDGSSVFHELHQRTSRTAASVATCATG